MYTYHFSCTLLLKLKIPYKDGTTWVKYSVLHVKEYNIYAITLQVPLQSINS